jgi:hypothetical protein
MTTPYYGTRCTPRDVERQESEHIEQLSGDGVDPRSVHQAKEDAALREWELARDDE